MKTLEKNISFTPHPKPRDGTQTEKPDRGDANWFGTSQIPQEEFIERTFSVTAIEFEGHERRRETSEGRATFFGWSIRR